MIRRAFKMKLYDGMADEYKRRHDNLWQEMKELITSHGGKNYSIFFDEETNYLFGYVEIEDKAMWSKSRDFDINQKWWEYMADIMETNSDNSPVSNDLIEVFHLD